MPGVPLPSERSPAAELALLDARTLLKLGMPDLAASRLEAALLDADLPKSWQGLLDEIFVRLRGD
jgi:hypothetical protein